MKYLAALLLIIIISGCAQLVGYTVGTLSNVTGDLIMRQIDDKKEKEKEQEKKWKGNGECRAIKVSQV